MLRAHVKVSGMDYKKHLKELHVRPFVIILLLDFLIERGHEVFKGKGPEAFLKAQVRAAVAREYPEREDHLPEDQRKGLPACIH